MSDVRLTATNPEDSSVVPVACNAKGELKLEEPIAPPEFDGNLDGDLTVTGKVSAEGDIVKGIYAVNQSYSALRGPGQLELGRVSAGVNAFINGTRYNNGVAELNFQVMSNGAATFKGDVVIGSRSKQWMLVEQGGLCHMVEQVVRMTDGLVDPAAAVEYPKLRDVFSELNVIEKALEEVMTKLRMTEPDGWPVWDGSDNSR